MLSHAVAGWSGAGHGGAEKADIPSLHCYPTPTWFIPHSTVIPTGSVVRWPRVPSPTRCALQVGALSARPYARAAGCWRRCRGLVRRATQSAPPRGSVRAACGAAKHATQRSMRCSEACDAARVGGARAGGHVCGRGSGLQTGEYEPCAHRVADERHRPRAMAAREQRLREQCARGIRAARNNTE